MSNIEPRLPEQYATSAPHVVEDFEVNELLSNMAGSLSPFGQELQFPLPIEKLNYTHPSAADRPNLAADGH